MPRVLLLETHDRTIRTVESTLGVIGYEVVVCDGTREKLKLVLRANPPDLILVSADLHGGSALDTLVQRYGDCATPVPVIAWSGYHKPSALKELAPVELLLSGVMSAPLDPGELVRLVAMLLPPPDQGAAVQVVADLVDDGGATGIRLEEPRGNMDLAKASLPRLLCAVDFHDWTGCLRVETPSMGIALFFEMGQLVLAVSDKGRDLIRTAQSLGRLTGANVPDVPLRNLEDEIGLLMALRGIGMHETEWIVVQTAIRLFGSCIEAWNGTVKAIPGLEPTGEGYAEPMPILPLLIASVGASFERAPGNGVQAHPDSVVVVRLPDEATIRSWALAGTSARVIDQLHKARGREIPFAQLVRVASGGDEGAEVQVRAVLSLLYRIGYVHFSGPPWDEPTMARLSELVGELHKLGGADHFTVLGLSRSADDKQIREALRSQSLKYHPDHMFDAHPRVLESAAALYAKVQRAYEVLRNPESRAAYVAELDSDADSNDMELAKVALARGKIRMRHKRYDDAVVDFREATLQSPDLVEAQVLLAWARFLQEPDHIKRAMGELSKIVRKDESVADAWYYLGRLAILGKDLDRARKYFDKALRMDPKHLQAQREIRLMDRRGQGVAAAPKSRSGLDDAELNALMEYQEEPDEDADGEDPESGEATKKKGFLARLRGRG